MRKCRDGGKTGKKEKKITTEIVTTNIVASRPTGTATARANMHGGWGVSP